MATSSSTLYGGVEGGGTKFRCAVATEEQQFLAETRIETTTPQETLSRVSQFFKPYISSLHAVGIGMFGPLDIEGKRSNGPAGSTLRTPKPGWDDVPVAQLLRTELDTPVYIDTDVNCAAWAEATAGHPPPCDPTLYITIGTGIGVGAYVHGQLLHGYMHPEMGHLPVQREVNADGTIDMFEGSCPFHQTCIEGMASGTALRQRLGSELKIIPPTHPVWLLTAGYIAQLIYCSVLCLCPERIVIGGGVLEHPTLLSRIREKAQARLTPYLPMSMLGIDMNTYIVPPYFGSKAGLCGATMLAKHHSQLNRR